MNPLSFIFEHLSSLWDETALLESCDWDEDRLEYVKHILEQSLSSIVLLEESNSLDDIMSSLKLKLSQSLSEKEVDACLCILERNLEKSLNITSEAIYEN